MSLIRCQFCYGWCQPNEWRKPSQCCAKCWLEIQAQLTQPEPDFTKENNRRITYTPEVMVIQ